jgi:preprotein translocase subunit SecB
MAETTTNGQGAADAQTMTGPGGVSLLINAQYIKDLSFENPRAPQSLIQPAGPPQVQLNVDVKAQPMAPDLFEVTLTLSAQAKVQDEIAFVVELAYCAVVTAKADDRNLIPILVLVETPRMLFPFARNIVAGATRDGGFPPLFINPIDFTDLLRRQQRGEAGTGGGPLPMTGA